MLLLSSGRESAEALGKCLIIRSGGSKALVLSDLHIGYEESFSERGAMVQRFQLEDFKTELSEVFKRTGRPKLTIIAGDLKHEFGRISRQEWRESLEVLDFLSAHSERVVLVRGNHDNVLGPIASRKDLGVVEEFKLGGFLIIHGHKIPMSESLRRIHTIIIGHEHPAITISDGVRSEPFKCFLVGRTGRFNLIVLPSFSQIYEGTDVRGASFLSPMLKNSDLGSFRVVACGPSLSNYDFGRLSRLEAIFGNE
ncbi:MAG: metallophosphoesterase [Candidatus Woesearchaeota archaeon]